MNQTTLPYVNLWLHKWYAFTPYTNRETTCIAFVYNKKKEKRSSRRAKGAKKKVLHQDENLDPCLCTKCVLRKEILCQGKVLVKEEKQNHHLNPETQPGAWVSGWIGNAF